MGAMHGVVTTRVCRCVVMVTVAADLYSPSCVAKVLHCADVALRLRSLADDAELVRLSADPHSAAGLVHVCKFSVPGCISLPVCEPMLLLVPPPLPLPITYL